MKKCKSGYYYCNTDKKCKPIPRGYRVGYGGYLRKEKDDDDSKNKSNGNGNGNGNGSHGNGNGGNGSNGGGNGGGMGESVIHEADFNLSDLTGPKKEYDLTNARERAMYNRLKKAGKNPLIKKVTEGSLHKWFKGSKSKDGKGGWVNVVTGGTCASDEPGEGTPKCVSSAKRASMSKKERLSAARRKKKADPGQQSKTGAAKPTYVSTDKPKKKKKMKEEFISLPLQLEVPQNDGEFKLGLMFRESLEQDRGMLFVFENTDNHSFHMKNTFIPLDIAFINEEGIIESIKELDPMNPIPVYPDGDIRYAIEVNRGWFAENGIEVGDIILEDTEETEIDLNEVKDKKGKGSGSKDACYHKVKSRYSVWPSAYASGALVKCRKVGAANWGNSKKEEVEYKNDQIVEMGIKKINGDEEIIKPEGKTLKKGKERDGIYKLKKGVNLDKAHYEPSNWRDELSEKCWPGYEKKGMKTMFGKRYPNCVKKSKKKK